MKPMLLAVWSAAVVAIAAPAAAKTAPVATPAPQPQVPAGYYLVQGSRIVSKPYENEEACRKALVAIKRDMRPGSDTLVCAHRRP